MKIPPVGFARKVAVVPFVLMALLIISACASTGGTVVPDDGYDIPEQAQEKAAPRSDLISQAELSEWDHLSAFDVVEKLRPHWLRARGHASLSHLEPNRAEVFLNGTRAGGLGYLGRVSAVDVKELRFWKPGQAAVRFGMGYPRGVIEVISKGL